MSEQHRTKRLNEFKELENIETDQYLIGIDDIEIGNGARIKFDNFVNSLISSDENNKIILGTDNKLYNLSAINLYLEDMIYKSGDWVLGDVNGERNMYESLQDDNIGNELTDTLYWKKIEFDASEIEFDASEIEAQLATKVDTSASNLNLNGKSLISGLSMPSDRYVDLTLGASGSTYTASANGYVYFAKSSGAADKYISLKSIFTSIIYSSGTGDGLRVWIPVKKGNSFVASYSATGDTITFRFYYAEGEE